MTQTQRIMLATIVSSKTSIPREFELSGVISTIENAAEGDSGKLYFSTERALCKLLKEAPNLDFETVFKMALNFNFNPE